jgi:serine-type D-Ala-D-Ala endopeptidase (penicillin-binding protein 7)
MERMSCSEPVPCAREMIWRFAAAAWHAFLLVLMLLVLRGSANGQSVAVVRQDGSLALSRSSAAPRPIASITKLMTALVVRDRGLDPGQTVTIQAGETSRHLRRRQKATVGELMGLLLVTSDNGAAKALARTAYGSIKTAVAAMNARAEGLSMGATRYADPAGLLASNTSTAEEQARLIKYVIGDGALASWLRTPGVWYRAGRRMAWAANTNRLLRDDSLEVVAGKTGTTSKAGYCLAAVLRRDDGEEVAVVVLGARRPAARFNIAREAFLSIGG